MKCRLRLAVLAWARDVKVNKKDLLYRLVREGVAGE